MKKFSIILGAAAVVAALASCDKSESNISDDIKADGPVSVNISVSSLGAQTKAIKSGWEKGDIINFYIDSKPEDDNLAYVPDFTLTYNGNGWDASPVSEKATARLQERGYLHGFWEGSNSCISAIEAGNGWQANGSRISFPDVDKTTSTGVKEYLVADFSQVSYIFDGKTITASVGKWHFITDFQIVVRGLPENSEGYSLSSSEVSNIIAINTNLKNSDGMSLCDAEAAGIGEQGRIAGIPNEDGVAFVGKILDPRNKNYTLKIVDNDTKLEYTYEKKNTSLDSQSGSTIVAVKFPISKAYIDLGLSVKWAAGNVGAISPKESGDYYAWGELEPYYEAGHLADIGEGQYFKKGKESGYNLNSYKFYNNGTYTKYNGTDYATLQPEDDVARQEYGEGWRLPSLDEFKEIADNNNTERTWDRNTRLLTIRSKKEGFKNQFIILPACGYLSDYYISQRTSCYYSNSTLYRQGQMAPTNVDVIVTYNGNYFYNNSVGREKGLPIRPVYDAN